MLVSDLCKKHVVTIEKGASLQEAALSMHRNRIGALVVVDSNGTSKPIGLVTDRDLALRGFGTAISFSAKIHKILGPTSVIVAEAEDASCVIQKMVQTGVWRLIVVNDLGEATGVISFDDIFQRLAKEMMGLSDVIQAQIEKPLDQSYWDNVIL